MKQMLYLSALTAAALSLSSTAQTIHGFEVHSMTVEKPSPDDGGENLEAYDKQMDELNAAGWRPSPKEAFLFGEKNSAEDATAGNDTKGEQGDPATAEELKTALEENTKLASQVEALQTQVDNQQATIKDLKAEAKEAGKAIDDLQQTLANVQSELETANAKLADEGAEPSGETEKSEVDGKSKAKSKKK